MLTLWPWGHGVPVVHTPLVHTPPEGRCFPIAVHVLRPSHMATQLQKTMMPGMALLGAKKEQVRTAYAVLWRLGFYFNRVHALFIFSCDIEVLNVDSRTRESCGVFWKIRQGVVNLCCSDAG